MPKVKSVPKVKTRPIIKRAAPKEIAEHEEEVKKSNVNMSMEQRNEHMRYDFIVEDLSIPELAEKYGLSKHTIEKYRTENNWVSEKKDFHKAVSNKKVEASAQVYAGMKAKFNLLYNDSWQRVINIVNTALDDPDKHLFDKKGNIMWGALEVLTGILEKAQLGQGKANGVMSHEAYLELELAKERIQIMKVSNGSDDKTSQEDVDRTIKAQESFTLAIENATKAVWEGEDLPKEYLEAATSNLIEGEYTEVD